MRKMPWNSWKLYRWPGPATGIFPVLDEPVSGLDPKMAETMYRLVERINREMGITVIMISHDILEAIPYATHILHMGREYFFGTSEEYRKSEYGRLFLI